MINPSQTGRPGEILRLRTLESVWVQGKLRMWGRWSYMARGRVGSMFDQLLTRPVITQSDISDVLRRMQEAGLSAPELEVFFRELLRGKAGVRSPSVPMRRGWPLTGFWPPRCWHRVTGCSMTYWWSATACEEAGVRLQRRYTADGRNGARQPAVAGLTSG